MHVAASDGHVKVSETVDNKNNDNNSLIGLWAN